MSHSPQREAHELKRKPVEYDDRSPWNLSLPLGEDLSERRVVVEEEEDDASS